MLDPSRVASFLILYVVFLFSTTMHEFAHARLGHQHGDPTADAHGLMTLDPTPHIMRSPFGMVVVPLLTYFLFGWPFPIGWASVPYDAHWGVRNPRGAALMSLAGPAANLTLALVAALIMHGLHLTGMAMLVGPGQIAAPAGAESTMLGGALLALRALLWINILLGLFNLMPMPPLDGAAVLEGFVPATRSFYNRLREAPILQLLGFLAMFNVFPIIIGPIQAIILLILFPNI